MEIVIWENTFGKIPLGKCLWEIPNNFYFRRNPLQLKNLYVAVIHTVVLEKGEVREKGEGREKEEELE